MNEEIPSPPDLRSQIPDPPHESHSRLFQRFLRFGLLAWGGPVAQIAMIRRELVDEEGWVTPEHFNRVFGLYQVLPGPEAHELCVYFGMQAGGRLGGLLAGLGFMLPGLVLMLALSWAYVTFGMEAAVLAAVFYGTQPAIAAVVLRAVHRIGQPVLHDRWLWAIAATAALGEIAGLSFLVSLPALGAAYLLTDRRQRGPAALVIALVSVVSLILLAGITMLSQAGFRPGGQPPENAPSQVALFGSGLRTGLLTFGGAYTAIPFLRNDAVNVGRWMTDDQFLDGLALTGILPAPLVIFGTFVGYVGGGLAGALALTAGIFLPAFAFTLVAHEPLERLVMHPAVHAFLKGVTAAVVGLIAVSAIVLARTAVTDAWTFVIAAGVLLLLYRTHAKLAILAAVIGGGVAGWLVQRFVTGP
jgi:chromate transporter